MAFPIHLTSLTTREAIIDAVYRATLAFDTGDVALFESTIANDATLDLNGKLMKRNAIRTDVFDPVSKLDTTHTISNIRVDIKSESSASVTCTSLAQHYREGQGLQPDTTRFLAGGIYFIDLVKDEKGGLWKSKHWKLKTTWVEGDMGVMTGH